MMNSANAKYKFSSLEKLMNFALVVVFLLQIVLASVGSAVGTSWVINYNQKAYYLDYATSEENINHVGLFFQKMCTWILIFTNFVPISLMVTLELVKFW
jgi:phospholipid-transporting ATPase